MKIVVTGHHGYIGSVTTAALVAGGHDVTGLDTLLYEGCDLDDTDTPVSMVRLDVRDVEPEHLDGLDAVVHLAALSNDPMGELDPDLTSEINFRATVRLARAAREAGLKRFVYASSCSMYGTSEQGELVAEDAPLRPLTSYARSKAESEEALLELADGDFSPVFMRNATAYGVSPRLRVDLVLNNLVGWAFTTGEVVILSDGTPWRPLVHVQDIATATLGMLEAPTEVVHAQAFNVGADSENYQVSDLAEIVKAAVGDCTIEYAGQGDPDPRSYRVSFSKFANAFPSLQLEWNAARGAEELLEAYRRTNFSFEDFTGPRYTRLKQLQQLLANERLDPELRWRARSG